MRKCNKLRVIASELLPVEESNSVGGLVVSGDFRCFPKRELFGCVRRIIFENVARVIA